MADKSRLVKSRGVYRGQITKQQNRVTEILANQELSSDDCDTVTLVLEIFREKLSLISNLDTQISELIEDDDALERFLEDADDYNTEVRETFFKFEKQLNRKLTPVPPPADPVEPARPVNPTSHRHINLPKLVLKQFNGNVINWSEFHDSFEAAVGLDTELTNVQKFQYLRAQLMGEPARVISGLSLTDANYEHAVDLLKKRYGQKHQIINAYMRALWELPKPHYTLDSLRDFYDSLESHIRGLSTLGKTIDSYGDLLIPVILDKLPPDVRKQIARDHEDAAWTIKDLRASLLREIKVLQAGEVTSASSDEHHSYSTAAFYTRTSPRPSGSRPSASLNVRTSPTKGYKCVFCKGSHSSIECTVITDKRKRHDIVVRDKLCWNCLGNHTANNCNSRFRCRTCKRKHHTSLCQESGIKGAVNSAGDVLKPSDSTGETKVSLATSNGPVLLKTAIAEISAGGHVSTVAILFDEGAQRSFITQETADLLNLNCSETENVKLSTFGKRSGVQSLPVTNFQLHAKTSTEQLPIRALVVPIISTPMHNYIDKSVVNLPHLKGLQLAHPCSRVNEDVISVLIGADYYWSIVGDRLIRGPGPTAVQSKLGFLLSGPTASTNHHVQGRYTSVHHVNVDSHSHDQDVFNLQRFWDLETLGIRVDEFEPTHDYTSYTQTHIRKDGDHYIAKLPWKEYHDPLPTNYGVVVKRTRAMVRRLPEDVRERYDEIIQDQISKDYIEPVPSENTNDGHYLPHRAVIKESSSTPLRIVYDCSSSQGNHGTSLNDCLQRGPSLLNDLTAILLRFRAHPVALSGDIRKAFLQIGLDSEDRKYTKFLWLSNFRDTESDLNAFQFKSILFGAVSSPFILNATIRHHLDEQNSTVTRDLKQNIYVDNVISGCIDTANAIIQYYDQANNVMTTGGFQLHSWSTNDPGLRDYIDRDGSLNPNSQVSVLGVLWDTQGDKLAYPNNIKLTTDLDVLSKRMVVQQIAKLYDPLGYLLPVFTRAKLFVQELWKSKYAWDQSLPVESVQKWQDISNDLTSATTTVYKRKYFDHNLDSDASFELHAFSDASQVAFGSSVYLRDVTHKQTALVMAKSRVAPIKQLTIPRLELLGVLVASKLLRFVFDSLREQFNIVKLVLWTDSQIVLHWITSEKKLPVFVSNRLKTIRSNAIGEFKYCPSADNPADIISRGVTFADFSESPIWFGGPEWLKHGDWPLCQLFDSAVLNVEIDSETIQSQDKETGESDMSHVPTTSFMDPERFSAVSKLYRVTAYVLRFIHNTRNTHSPRTASLSAGEISQAEKLWLQRLQTVHYQRELEILRDNKTGQHTPLIKQMRLFYDKSGLLRVGGRLHNAPLPYDAKFPILLPPNNVYTRLLIHDAHRRAQHSGAESTITLLRQNYWITSIRRAVKTVIHECVHCKRIIGLPYQLPDPAPLQSSRLQDSAPFTVCGLDYTGALYVKSDTSTRKETQAYILLFTCASTRAIHLELVPNLSVHSFLLAFRRFVARRSLPRKLISDNASTFISARDELKKLFDSPDVKDFMLNQRIDWSMITKRAPWHGGFYERMIGITKTSLKKILGRAFVTYEELTTVITEVEAAINNRPITYLSTDTNDPSPLTPSHLLHGRMITNLPHVSVVDDDITDPTFGSSKIGLEKRFMYLANLLAHFQQRWKNEYVISLRERHSHFSQKTRSSSNPIKVGDVVLVHDEKARLKWNLALVVKLNYGNDNEVRSAEIKMKNRMTNRPINRLYPLEISSNSDSDFHDNSKTAISNGRIRIMRQAAHDARDKIKILSEGGFYS